MGQVAELFELMRFFSADAGLIALVQNIRDPLAEAILEQFAGDMSIGEPELALAGAIHADNSEHAVTFNVDYKDGDVEIVHVERHLHDDHPVRWRRYASHLRP